MATAGLIEPKQVGRVVNVVDDDVDVAVVVEVGKGRSAGGFVDGDRHTELRRDIRKSSVVKVPIDNLGLFVAGL
jgi:hypothetical protein